MIEIRKMNYNDIDQIYEIECNSFKDPWSKQALIYEIELQEAVCLVAVSREKVVGYAGLRQVFNEGHINNIAVDKAYQLKGIGTMILKALIDKCRNMGMEKFTLEARVSNVHAIKMYEKLGFYSLGIRQRFYENPIEDAIIMWLE